MKNIKKMRDELRHGVEIVHQAKDSMFASIKEIVREAGGFLKIPDRAEGAFVAELVDGMTPHTYYEFEIGALRLNNREELQYVNGRGKGFERFWDDDSHWKSLDDMDSRTLVFTLMTLSIAVSEYEPA